MPTASPSSRQRLILLSPQPIYRFGLSHLARSAGFEVLGESGDVTHALDLAIRTQPELAALDFSLGSQPATQLIGQLLSAHRDLRVLVLLNDPAPRFVVEAMQAGAHGYVVKSEPIDAVLGALCSVAAGGTFHSTHFCRRPFFKFLQAGPSAIRAALNRLSDREREVFLHTAEGHTPTEIAALLQISIKTVETHRANVVDKLRLQSSAELLEFAHDWRHAKISLSPPGSD